MSIALDQPPHAAAQIPVPPVSALAKIKILMDDDTAAAKLCDRCRRACPDATDEEILHFLELAINSRRTRAVVVGNWREELIAALPQRLTRTEIERYRRGHPRSE